MGGNGAEMVSIVCKTYTDHTRPEFDSPLLQKGWFDSNSVAECLWRRDTVQFGCNGCDEKDHARLALEVAAEGRGSNAHMENY